MKKLVSILIFILAPAMIFGQHTFSIVAIDSITKEVGSAGATCGDEVLGPGTRGARRSRAAHFNRRCSRLWPRRHPSRNRRGCR